MAQPISNIFPLFQVKCPGKSGFNQVQVIANRIRSEKEITLWVFMVNKYVGKCRSGFVTQIYKLGNPVNNAEEEHSKIEWFTIAEAKELIFFSQDYITMLDIISKRIEAQQVK